MSIYKSSTLAMIPTAYKDGKLYSVRPTDGSGDFTFSRGSNLAATRVASSGYIEKGRENLLLQSNTFDTTWALSSASITGGHSGYDGTNTAWELTKAAASGRVQQTISTSGVQTYSVYAKAGSYDWALLLVTTTSGDRIGYFDLANGVVGTGFSLIDSSIESVGGGWYRCTIVFTASTTTARVYPALGDTNLGTSGNIYIQDAQLEAGLVATDYIETTTTSVSAGILEDMPRLDYSGGASCPSLLLEPQRSNLVPFSEHLESSDWAKTRCTIEDNSTTSPEGVMNASKMTSTDASESYIQDNLATTGTKITWSFFAKKGDLDYAHGLVWDLSANGCRQWFNLSTGAVGGTTTFGSGYSVDSATIEDYGNGWYRCAMVVNSTAGTQGCRVNISSADTTIGSAVNSYGYFYGIQLEDASYPTSYIPTYGASVTRSLDSTETATPSTSLFNQTEGVIYAEWENVSNGNSRLLNLKGGGHQIYIKQFGTSSERIFGVVYNGSGNVFSAATPNNYLTIGDTYKAALRYKDGEYAFYVNGTQIATSTATGLGSMAADKIDLENNDNAGSCKHKQAIYFPTALTDTELASLTTL